MNEETRPSKRTAIGPQGTMIFRPGDLPIAGSGDSGPDHPVSGQPRLVGVSEGFEGRIFMLRPGRTLIGRRATSDIVLDAGSVSALHAWIVQERDGFRIINALSTNGTFVNGRKVHEASIADGELIRLGQVELRFHSGQDSKRRGAIGALIRTWPWLLAGIAIVAFAGWALLYR
jgi:hypothetical protein